MLKPGSKRAETKNKKPLHYTACGLDDIYLMSGYEIVKTSHGEGTAINKLDELHLAIDRNLAERKKVLSAKALRFLRKHMNLTQSELGKLLGLTSQQVARWKRMRATFQERANFCSAPTSFSMRVEVLTFRNSLTPWMRLTHPPMRRVFLLKPRAVGTRKWPHSVQIN